MELIQDLCKQKKKQLGKTSRDIAEETDLPIGTINKFFAASSVSPGVVVTAAICAALGVSIDAFYGISVPPDAERAQQLERERNEIEQQLDRERREGTQQLEHEREKYALLLDTIAAQQNAIDGLQRSVKNLRHIIFALLIIIALLLIYGITLDVPNPEMGLFRGGM